MPRQTDNRPTLADATTSLSCIILDFYWEKQPNTPQGAICVFVYRRECELNALVQSKHIQLLSLSLYLFILTTDVQTSDPGTVNYLELVTAPLQTPTVRNERLSWSRLSGTAQQWALIQSESRKTDIYSTSLQASG